MTVTYTLSVAESRLSGFPRLLIKWKGSIYKLLYREMVIFCFFFYLIHIVYHKLFNENQKRIFNQLSSYCDTYTNFIPLSFVLGFYVTMVVTRWWHSWLAIPWPDKLAMLISAFVNGTDERSKLIRLTLMRYMLAMECLTFQAISTSVRRRYPSEEDLIEAGLMTQTELNAYLEIEDSFGRWWIPGQWFTSLLIEAFEEGKITHQMFLREIISEMHVFRGNCGSLFAFDWINIPLVYTQTVTIAVYTYFGAKLIGRQYITRTLTSSDSSFISSDNLSSIFNQSESEPTGTFTSDAITLYIPFFTIAEFFFFMGWLKVAEQLINPFGEDDDDFEVNWILDRNIFVSFSIVDNMNRKYPDLSCPLPTKSELTVPPTLITSTSDLHTRRASINPHSGSTMNLDVAKQRRPSRPSSHIDFLTALSNEKLTLNSEVNCIDETNKTSDNNQNPLNWEHRAMSFCVPSDNMFQLAESRQSVGRTRKLSLEESRSGKSFIKPTVKLQTHVECIEDSLEGVNQTPDDDFSLLLGLEESEKLNQ